ncbi:diacylglycerol kinase theta-like isoform X1 [Homarus americanus]|uniref:diacylglycerol kinase theta-like isoform X1 n=1 Tax=Homarus americanus TaxID=6706 RepID=UPI001C474F72|nr:diacylglycerol kinase theta-like isoform X1 [Homarus americanus]
MAHLQPPTSPPAHCFVKRTFHKPVYCHHCTDLLWGIIGQGYTCEVCNFVVHDKCMKTVVSPCSSIAPTLIKTPVAHCWSEPLHLRRRHCNVCRKKLDDTWAIKCEVCEYDVHVECEDFTVPNCKDCATFVPEKTLPQVIQQHHWREGNLPANSKCIVDKKTCWTGECLAGMRCEWCGYTVHAMCADKVPTDCTFGLLEPIMLPPTAVSIPRTEVPMEAIIGVQSRRKDTLSPRSISEEFTSGDYKARDNEEPPRDRARDRDEKDEEVVKVFDGNNSLRRRMFRLVTVSRAASVSEFLTAAMRAFHVPQENSKTYLTDAYSAEETELTDPLPVGKLTRRDGKRPAVFLRYREKDNDEGCIRVYPSRLGGAVVMDQTVLPVTSTTCVTDIIVHALNKFGIPENKPDDYRLVEVILDKGVSERVMENIERPWELLKAVGRDSIRQMEMTRFYLQLAKDPHGPSIALFVGSLPPNLSQRQYENILADILGKAGYKYSSIGPIYYEYGSMVLTYEDSDLAVRAFYTLRESCYDDKNLLVMLLPNIQPQMIPEGVQPLLVFVNVKSGGCQGLELITSFRKLLNPYQVFDLDNGGPLPGLYVFRHVKKYKILVCGGDGTIGWVLQCLDNVGQDSECQHPACAIVPLGTGNDLARVLRWGPGYNGGEDPINLLKDVIDAEDIRLDRWTVVFHQDEKVEDKQTQTNSTGHSRRGMYITHGQDSNRRRCVSKEHNHHTMHGSTSEDNTQIFVMNNYFGIGIEAELCLDFHNAREENPNKFNSRLHNKGVYVKMGLRKMVSRKLCKDLHKEIRLEVDGRTVELPPVEGVIILNILSWGSGANPWGPEKDDQFNKPNHWDGHLEVVGVTGIVHLGQIQSGLRSAIRIAQGGHIRIKLNSELPVQVDGEPWNQAPGEVVVLKSALKATMLKKTSKSKLRRRNTEPSMVANEQAKLETIRPDPASSSHPL